MLTAWLRRAGARLADRRRARADARAHGEAVRTLRAQQAAVEAGCPHRVSIVYAQRPDDLLARLCDAHGSDKGTRMAAGHAYPWPAHSYADFYARLFGHCRAGVARVFECGIGTADARFAANMGAAGRPGASLRVWRDYFPNATIHGADLDRAVLFAEDRIRTHHVDQTDPAAVAALWAEVGAVAFDLMVDDGLHEFAAGRCLFEHSAHMLQPHGVYVIEDVPLADLRRYQAYFEASGPASAYAADYVSLFRPDTELWDNNLVVVRRRDPATAG